jgi:hypothetical protein
VDYYPNEVVKKNIKKPLQRSQRPIFEKTDISDVWIRILIKRPIFEETDISNVWIRILIKGKSLIRV